MRASENVELHAIHVYLLRTDFKPPGDAGTDTHQSTHPANRPATWLTSQHQRSCPSQLPNDSRPSEEQSGPPPEILNRAPNGNLQLPQTPYYQHENAE